MMVRIVDLLKRRFKSSYHTKVFALYSVFTIGVLILSFFISINLFNENFEKEIKESNKRLLTQVQIQMDKDLFEKVSSIINEKFLDPYAISIPSSFFVDTDQRNAHIVLGAFRSIFSTLNNCEYIDSICLYRKSDDTTLSTDEGIRYNIFSPDSKMPPFPYVNIVKDMYDISKTSIWMSPKENQKYYTDKSMISYIQSVPLYSPMNESDGYIIINIDQKILFKQISEIYGQNGDIMLIDPNGTLYAHNDTFKLMGDLTLGGDLESILQSDENFMLGNINGKQMGISWMKSSYKDWKYISVISLEHLNKKTEAVSQMVLLILVFFIALSLVGLKVITSTLFKPFKKLIFKVKGYLGIAEGGNELKYINNVFSYLSVKVDDMEETIRNNQEIIKYKTVIDILFGNISNEEEFKNRFKLFDTSFEFKYFTVLIIEIDRKVFSQLTVEQREFIISKANEYTHDYLSEQCRIISIVHPSNCIAAILDVDANKPVIPDMNELLNCLKNVLGVKFNIAIGEMTEQGSSLGRIYSATIEYLKYSYIYDFNNVFTSSVIKTYESNTGDLDTRVVSQMETYLRTCKEEAFIKLINGLVDSIKRNQYSLNYTQNFLNRIVEMVSNICTDHEVAEGSLTKSKLLCDFNSLFSLDECVDWIYSIVSLYFAKISKRNLFINDEFIEKILQFIRININDQQICLKSVADEFNMSPSYLSRLFKDALNISFSEFVLDQKLERAAELIITSGNKNISTISESLGYLTPAYFSRIFKEKYGMTPVLYRKKYTNSSH